MVTINATENTNSIYWEMVTESSPFTRAQVSEMLRRTRRMKWQPMNSAVYTKPNAANEDIDAGRIHRFNTIDDLLGSLRTAR